MVFISADDFDEAELEQIISERCSEFGSVVDVTVRRDSNPKHYDLALVEMSTAEEASKVVEELGDQERGTCVIMKIQHEGKDFPTLH